MPCKANNLKGTAMFIPDQVQRRLWLKREWNDRPSNWRGEVKTCHRYLIKKPMFSMDYIIPAIDLTEPWTWIDGFSSGGGLLGNIFTPRVLRVKVIPPSIYYFFPLLHLS